MHLYLNQQSGSLMTESGMFIIKNGEDEHRFAPVHLTSICISQQYILHTNALILAMKHQIPVVLLKSNGMPEGIVYSTRYQEYAELQFNQFAWCKSGQGWQWLIRQHTDCTNRRIRLLERMKEKQGKKARHTETQIANMKLHRDSLIQLGKSNPAKDYQALIKLIPQLEKPYFEALSSALPKAFRFEKRSKGPSKDKYNTLLNYLTGIQYHICATAMLKQGVNPYLPFRLASDSEAISWAQGFQVLFHPWAEWTALRLCQRERIGDEHFRKEKGSLWLTPSGRKLAAEKLHKYLDRKKAQKPRAIRRRKMIQEEARKLKEQLKKSPS